MTVLRVSMHKIKEVPRLKYAIGLKQRRSAAALGLSNGVVAKYLAAAERAHLPYPLPSDWDDTDFARALFGASYQPAPVKRLTLDFAFVQQELKRKGVTRQLLWDEYRATHPEGYGYTQSQCALFGKRVYQEAVEEALIVMWEAQPSGSAVSDSRHCCQRWLR